MEASVGAMVSGVPGKTLMGSRCPGLTSLEMRISILGPDGWCHHWHANTKVMSEHGTFSTTINTPRWTIFSNKIFIVKLYQASANFVEK